VSQPLGSHRFTAAAASDNQYFHQSSPLGSVLCYTKLDMNGCFYVLKRNPDSMNQNETINAPRLALLGVYGD